MMIVIYIVYDEKDEGDIYLEQCFLKKEEAINFCRRGFNRLSDHDKKRSHWYVLETDDSESIDGNIVFRCEINEDSAETRKKIIYLGDMIEGEINRICVTDDLNELDKMVAYAKKNIEKLQELRYKQLKGR